MSLENLTNMNRFNNSNAYFPPFQPTFGEYTSLPCCSYGGDSPSSEDSFGCFSTDPLTPPLSPNVELPAIDTFTSSFLTNPSTSAVDELLSNNFAHDFPPVLPDLKETCSEVFEEESTNIHDSARKIFSQSFSKDCMWNGNNLRTRRHSRSASPDSPSCCSPVSGCVNPRYVFSHFSGHKKSSSPRRLQAIKRPQKSNDSEEEVDVVTVPTASKKISTTTKHPTTLGVICDNSKVLNTLLQKKNGTQSQLTLVATRSNRLESTTTSQQIRGRSNLITKSSPAMSMVISGGGGTKTLNLQLKCVPVINSNSTQHGVKRKMNISGDQAGNTVVHLMRLTPTSPTNSLVSETAEEEERNTGGKRRFLSLDGISMVSNTGIKQARNEMASGAKNEPIASEVSSFPMQTVKQENAPSAIVTDRKKPTRKYTKKAMVTPYETPTSSPGSSNGDSPVTSPARRKISGGRCSGSEEDSIRAAHNVLERQRRQGLRNLYGALRELVPELVDFKKASKLCILTKAKEHINELKHTSDQFKALKRSEMEKQQVLKDHLREMAAEIATVGSTPVRNSFYREVEYPASNYAVFVN